MRGLSRSIVPGLLAAALLAAFARGEEAPASRRFIDVAAQAGLEGKPGAFPSWCDADGDGRPDLFAGGRLYRNQGPPDFRFEDVTASAFGSRPGRTGIFFDADNDGDADLAVPGPDEKDGRVLATLWVNDGTGRFAARPLPGAEERPDHAFVATLGAGDLDGDGFADLFLVCNEDWNDGKPRTFRSFVLRNVGGKGFSDATVPWGLADAPRRYGRGVAFADYNDDGRPDVYVSNYRIEDNFLWENRGGGRLVNVAKKRDVAGKSRMAAGQMKLWYGHSIGAAWGDLDNDGHLDLWVSNLVHKDGKLGYHRGYICDDSKVYRNGGPPEYGFADRRVAAGIPLVPLDQVGRKADGTGAVVDELWAGAALGDVDNDGFLDAFVPQVYDLPWAFAHLYRNTGNFAFRQEARESGIELFDAYHGAFADYDGDGDLDLAAFGRPAVGEKPVLRLYRNDGPAGGWLKLRLRGTESNGSALGARVTLRFADGLMVRQVEGGTSSHGQQNGPAVHFGLGDRTPTTLEIRWPSGRVEVVDEPAPRTTLVRTEPAGPRAKILSFTWTPQAPAPGDAVTFTVKAEPPQGGRIQGYSWDFEADHRFDAETPEGTATRTFDTAGARRVRVRVRCGDGQCEEATARLEVAEGEGF